MLQQCFLTKPLYRHMVNFTIEFGIKLLKKCLESPVLQFLIASLIYSSNNCRHDVLVPSCFKSD